MIDSKLNFFKKVAYSVYNVKAYTIFNKFSVGKAFKYLFLLTVTLGILSSISPIISYNVAINGLSKDFLDKAPYFELKDGKLKVDGKMPIIYESGESVIVIDTTGKTTVSSLQEYNSYLLITSTNYIQKQSFRENKINFRDLNGFTITKESVQKLIPLLNLVSILIIIFVPIGFFVVYLFFALILSLIGLIINSIVKSKLSFGNIFKLGIYALTLPTIIEILLNAFSIHIPYFAAFKIIIAAIFLSTSFTKIKKENEQEPEVIEQID